MDDDDETPYDVTAPELVAARDAISRAINNYLQLLRPSENPYPVAWVIGVEWTNTELEQQARAGRDTIMPNEQTISASGGLGTYIANRYT